MFSLGKEIVYLFDIKNDLWCARRIFIFVFKYSARNKIIFCFSDKFGRQYYYFSFFGRTRYFFNINV